MIKIVKVESHLGEGVYSMIHESCPNDSERSFLVNARDVCPVNYNEISGLVNCPWCHTGVALSVILENYEKEKKLGNFVENVREVWSPDDSKEEQK